MIVLAIIVTGLTALAASSLQQPLYTASAVIEVSEQEEVYRTDSSGSVQSAIDTEISKSRSLSKAKAVADALKLDLPPEELLAVVSVEPEPSINAFTLTAKSDDPKMAASIANEFANVVVNDSKNNSISQIDKTIKLLNARLVEKRNEINAVGGNIDASKVVGASLPQAINQNAGISVITYADWQILVDSYSQVSQKIEELRLTREQVDAPLSLVRDATVPVHPATPTIPKNILFGLAAGLIMGIGIALVLEYLDDSIRTEGELKKYFAAPVIGVIRAQKTGIFGKTIAYKLMSEDKLDSVQAEDYRKLATNLEFMLKEDGGKKSIMFTNSKSRQGGPEVLMNLAVAMAKAGKKVVVIGCNMRNPRLSNYHNTYNIEGLVSVLNCGKKIEEYFLPTEIPNLHVVPSGSMEDTTQNPADLLNSEKMDLVLEKARDRADIVFVDAPSITETADAAILAQKVDGVIVVASLGEIRRELADSAMKELEVIRVPIFGLISFIRNKSA